MSTPLTPKSSQYTEQVIYHLGPKLNSEEKGSIYDKRRLTCPGSTLSYTLTLIPDISCCLYSLVGE